MIHQHLNVIIMRNCDYANYGLHVFCWDMVDKVNQKVLVAFDKNRLTYLVERELIQRSREIKDFAELINSTLHSLAKSTHMSYIP